MNALVTLLRKIGNFALVILFSLIGNISWNPPRWMRWGGGKLLGGGLWIRNPHNANPRRFWSYTLASVLLVSISAAGYRWYKNRPKPYLITVTSTSIPATSLTKDALPAAVYFNFSGSAARIEQIGKVVDKGFAMSPSLPGEWKWASDSQLVFTPKSDWGVGQEYVLEFEKSFFPSHVRLAEYEHRFSSASFSSTIQAFEFYADPLDPKLKKAVATVRFSHPVDKSQFEKRISLVLQLAEVPGLLASREQNFGFKVSYDEFGGEAYIHSDPIPIPSEDARMLLKVKGGYGSSRGGKGYDYEGESSVRVPGMFSYFQVSSVEASLARNRFYEPEQVMFVNTTVRVHQDELKKSVKAYLLPRNRPAFQGKEAIENYEWYSTDEIGPEVLKEATELPLEWIPAEQEFSVANTFRYTAEVGRHLYVRIGKGIKSYGDYVLARDHTSIIKVGEFPREVKIMHDGALLSLTGDRKLSVITRDVEAIRIELSRVLPGSINHLATQTLGTFQRPYFHSPSIFGADNMSELFTEVRPLPKLEPGKTHYTAVDLGAALAAEGATTPRGLFFLKILSWDPKNNIASGAEDERLVLLTDLGVLVKDSQDGSQDVFVQSFRTGLPESDATIEILGRNGIPILSRVSDSGGRVSFPSLKDFEREKTPSVYLVKKGGDLSFLPFNRYDRRLNLSRFDIGGTYISSDKASLQAFLFSGRGIYRPGDEMNIGMIVKPIDWRQNIDGVPLEAAVVDARGLEVHRKKLRFDTHGFQELSFTTQENSPTGYYQVNLYIVQDGQRGNLLGSVSVRVEEFLPDRLKISSTFVGQKMKGWVAPDELTAEVQLSNLFGTPAADRKVTGSIRLSPAFPAFPEHRDYTFFDPLQADKSVSEDLEPQYTDENGLAKFVLDLGRFDAATYRLLFSAEGFEAEGGRSVASQAAVTVSPQKHLIGYKPDGDFGYIKKDSARTVSLIAVNPDLERITVAGLKAHLVEKRNVSVLVKQPNGTYAYSSVQKEVTVSNTDLEILAAGVDFGLKTDAPGDYSLIIRDALDKKLNSVDFSVVGETNAARELEKNAELVIKLNKGDFAPGEEIELQIQAPYTGAGLITIEREKVYSHTWFKAETTSSVQRIRVPEELEGNGYVNVSFVRSLDSKEIFVSPLSYGVAPFTVSRERRTTNINLEVPEVVRPGEQLRIGYHSDRPSRIVVFAVDEGILQVARYKLPDPLSSFLQKRALEVQTSQILDLLLPEFEILKSLSAPGGDGEGELGSNLNPFKRKRLKPVVYWSGIIDSDQNRRELTYEVPDYFNGAVRVMAIAVSNEAIGRAEKAVTVRGDFVISPNVPTFVAPGDEFEVSLNVANNVDKSGKALPVKLELQVSSHLELLESPVKEIQIDEGREGALIYKVRAGKELGSGSLAFRASSADKSASYTVDLSVRPATPFMTTSQSGQVTGKSVEVPVLRKMHQEYRVLNATASVVPLVLARSLVVYLKDYPYSCTEQLVSKAFAAIVLKERAEFGYVPEGVEEELWKLLAVLEARQNSEGAFGFWAANSEVSDTQTVYALHFVTEAIERGYPIPRTLLEKGLAYLNGLVAQPATSLSDARLKAYALYVLTRNGQVTSTHLNVLRDLLDQSHSKYWKEDLTGIYLAAVYKMLKQDRQAEALVKHGKMTTDITPDYEYFYDDLSHDAQLLYILSRHFPEYLASLETGSIIEIAEHIGNGNFNSLTSSYSILALHEYAKQVKSGTVGDFSITLKYGEPPHEKAELEPGQLFPVVPFSDKVRSIEFENPGKFPLFYQTTEAGFDLEPPLTEIKQGLELIREYKDEDGNPLKTVTTGDKINVWITVRAVDRDSIPDVAVIDLLPGGFEVDIDSESSGGRSSLIQNDQSWSPAYVDIREDRVVLYGEVGSSAKQFVYRVRPTNKGKYLVPPLFGESMYERKVQGRSLGSTVNVEGDQSPQ